MVTQLSTDEARDRDALLYLRNVDQWQKQIVLRNGRRVYGIPSRSRPGLFHLTDGTDCTCEDHAGRGFHCAHMRAARLYRMERQAQQIADAKCAARGLRTYHQKYAALYPQCAVDGCDNDPEPREKYCHKHVLVDAF